MRTETMGMDEMLSGDGVRQTQDGVPVLPLTNIVILGKSTLPLWFLIYVLEVIPHWVQ